MTLAAVPADGNELEDMLRRKEPIEVTLRLYGGLARELVQTGQNGEAVVKVRVPRGSRVDKVLKAAGLRTRSPVVCFLNGERAASRRRLEESCELICMVPGAGG